MYNRYVPGYNGTYQRHTIPDPATCREKTEEMARSETVVCEQPTKSAQQQNTIRRSGFGDFDLGDLLLLCIVILLLIDSEEEDTLPLLIMAAVFLFWQ